MRKRAASWRSAGLPATAMPPAGLAEPGERTRARQRLAVTSLGALAAFAGLVLLLHAIKPELDPSWRFLSEYSIGPHGWVMTTAFLAWALSCVMLCGALRDDLTTRWGRVGLVVLAAVALSLVVAGLFEQDPLTAKPDELTTHGTVHAVASMVGIPGFPIAALLITRSLSRHRPQWFAAPRVLMLMAHLTWLSLLAMAVYLAVAVPRAGGFGPDVQAGWMNRLVVLSYCAWQGAVAYIACRTQDSWRPISTRSAGLESS